MVLFGNPLVVLDAAALELPHHARVVHLQVVLQLRKPIANQFRMGLCCNQGVLVSEVPSLPDALLLVGPVEGGPEVRMKRSHNPRQLPEAVPDKWFL